MAAPDEFEWFRRSSGDVEIRHRGRTATVLRGSAVNRFLADIDRGDPQELMARVTGNYKRGNERQAKNHLRNRKQR